MMSTAANANGTALDHAEEERSLDSGVREVRRGGCPRAVLPEARRSGGDDGAQATCQPRFQRIRELGVGGMGEVSLVLDRDIGRLVAVKRLLPDLEPATAVRFANEIRTLGQIEHPNIVPIYDVGMGADGRFFFVMKYVDGDTLARVLEGLRAGDPVYLRRYPLERRVAIFVDVLRALSAAHAHGVLHRDIKPSNIMVTQEGAVLVMDWGIAKDLTDARPERSSTLGTPGYMSPEQAWGWNDRLDARSDLYSATVLFHELVTLRHYLGQKPAAERMLLAVISSDTSFAKLVDQDVSCANARVPVELYRIIARGLAKEPGDRYASADDMIADLTGVLHARAALARVSRAGAVVRGLALAIVARAHMALLAVIAFAGRLRSRVEEQSESGVI